MEEDVSLPSLDTPVPASWQTLEGPFHNVYAIKQVKEVHMSNERSSPQPWLDYSTLFCPDSLPAEGRMWLVVIKGSMGRQGLLRYTLASSKLVSVKSGRLSKLAGGL